MYIVRDDSVFKHHNPFPWIPLKLSFFISYCTLICAQKIPWRLPDETVQNSTQESVLIHNFWLEFPSVRYGWARVRIGGYYNTLHKITVTHNTGSWVGKETWYLYLRSVKEDFELCFLIILDQTDWNNSSTYLLFFHPQNWSHQPHHSQLQWIGGYSQKPCWCPCTTYCWLALQQNTYCLQSNLSIYL